MIQLLQANTTGSRDLHHEEGGQITSATEVYHQKYSKGVKASRPQDMSRASQKQAGHPLKNAIPSWRFLTANPRLDPDPSWPLILWSIIWNCSSDPYKVGPPR